jgi:hypothetical protein
MAVILLVAGACSAGAADLAVSQPVQVTNNSYYERGESIVYDGADYWLFYGRSTTVTGWYQNGNPDTHDYEVYYKKASSVPGLASAGAAKVVGINNTNGYLGETGAAYYGSDIWAFATVDVGPSADIYGWWTSDGGANWNEVGPIVTGLSDGQAHHDEISFGGKLWVVEGSGNFNTIYSSTPKTGGWSSPLAVGALTGGLVHFFIEGSDLYLAIFSAGANYIYKYQASPEQWNLIDSIATSGWDPTLYKVGTSYVFAQAPWTSEGGGRQYVIQWSASTLDGSFFDGGSKMVVEGRYGTNTWVDMWPIGFTDSGGDTYLFYTSERDQPGQEGTGNIWYLKVDWDVSLGHHTYIQEAIDAVTGSTVNVAAGNYDEYLVIQKSIELIGADKTTTTVTYTGSPTVEQLVMLGWNTGGTITGGATIEGFTFLGDVGLDGDRDLIKLRADGEAGFPIIIQDNIFQGDGTTRYLGIETAYDAGHVRVLDNEFDDLAYGAWFNVLNDAVISGNTITDAIYAGLAACTSDIGAIHDVDIVDNTILRSTTWPDAPSYPEYEVWFTGLHIGSTVYNMNITGNTIADGNYHSVAIHDRGTTDLSGVLINDNEYDNNPSGFLNEVTTTVDATCNWWGHIDGPNDPPGNPSSGDDVDGSIAYVPWLDSAPPGTCDQYGGNNVAAEPGGDCLSTNNPCETVSVNFNRTDTTPARAATVTIELSSELQLCGSGIQQGTWLDGYASVFEVVDNGGGSYTVDQAILGTPCGVTTGGELFTVDVEPSGGDGTGTITVTSVSVRDCDNPPAILAGNPGAPGSLTIDNTLPAAITDLTSTQWQSGNDSDGTTKIDLAWTAVESGAWISLYRKGYGDYPEYDDGTGSVPTAPTDPGDARDNGWAHVDSITAVTTYTDEPSTRDFWYYVAFVIDGCTNVSAVSNLADDTRRNNPGTLNYHLGDIASGGYDNNVKTDDMSELSSAYGSTDGGAGWNNEADVGPTTDFSTNGRPTTDDRIDFDDLLMFAINFGIEGLPFQGDRPVAMALEETPELALHVESLTSRELVARLILEGNTMAVKGIHGVVTFDESHLDLLEVTEGVLLSDQVEPVFFKDLEAENGRVVDMAVLGVDKAFRGSGEVAVLKFRVHRVGSLPVLEETKLRDIHNRPVGESELARQLLPSEEEALPTDLRFLGARPNPFNGTTMLVFELPSAAPVKLRIYDVRGRLVRTLMDGYASPGRHNVVWDGHRNDGRKAGVGVYLYTFQAGDHRDNGKIFRIR